MRIDLPQCNFKTCCYCLDGNCVDKQKYERCELPYLKQKIEDMKKAVRLSRAIDCDSLSDCISYLSANEDPFDDWEWK